MQAQLTQKGKVYNRRSNNRTRSFSKAIYSLNNGMGRRTEIINVSPSGARVTTAVDAVVGDTIEVLSETHNGVSYKMKGEVRWVAVLPCGRRQVVGLSLLAPPVSIRAAA